MLTSFSTENDWGRVLTVDMTYPACTDHAFSSSSLALPRFHVPPAGLPRKRSQLLTLANSCGVTTIT